MTNETTASQLKSIGDDAQFLKLLTAVETAPRYSKTLSEASSALITAIDSRAPAAQASATIQAAPIGWTAKRVDGTGYGNLLYSNRQSAEIAISHNGAEAPKYEIVPVFVATIQEPVMVAEPVGLAKTYSCETGQIDEALADFLAEHTRLNQDGIDTHAMNMTLALNYAAITPTPDEEIARWREQGYLPDTAPMVADPAGVAVNVLKWQHRTNQPYARRVMNYLADSNRQLRLMQDEIDDLRAALTATVKAVPSEALDAARYRFLRDGFNPLFIMSGPDPDGCNDCPAIIGDIADSAIDRAIAAPLTDKTGGGE